MELEFIRYNDNYENEVNLINKEMASERKITNLGGFDKKNSKLVVLNGKVIGFSSVLLSRGTPTIQYGIKKEYRKIETIGKINKTLRRASEAKISELSSELRDILSTLEVPTEEYINNRLYAIAEFKLREIKNRLDSKITYLENVMEEIA